MTPGARGPALFTLQVEHYYVVLSGSMTVQIGTDAFVAGPMTGVVIPAGTPHAVWNAGAEPEAHLEVVAPAPSRDLMSMLKHESGAPERHLTFLLPQNVEGPADIEFEMKPAAPARSGTPPSGNLYTGEVDPNNRAQTFNVR